MSTSIHEVPLAGSSPVLSQRMVLLPLRDLRLAVTAVLPHAGGFDPLDRVRIVPTPDISFVMATNRYSAAIAKVQTLEAADLTGSVVDDGIDLPAKAAGDVLRLFRPPKDEAGALEVRVTRGLDPEHTPPSEAPVVDRDVTVTDMSGLFPGKAYKVPAVPEDGTLPQLPALFQSATGGRPTMPGRMSLSGGILKLFAAADKAYEEPLVLRATRKAGVLQVACGDHFLGVIAPRLLEDDSEETEVYRARQAAWSAVLRDITPPKGEDK